MFFNGAQVGERYLVLVEGHTVNGATITTNWLSAGWTLVSGVATVSGVGDLAPFACLGQWGGATKDTAILQTVFLCIDTPMVIKTNPASSLTDFREGYYKMIITQVPGDIF